MKKLLKTFVFFQRSKKGNYNLLIASLGLTASAVLIQTIIGPYYYSEFVSHLERQVISRELTWQNAVMAGVLTYVVTVLIGLVMQYFSSLSITKLENKTMEKIDNFTAKHILDLSLDFFKDRFTGSLVSKQTAFSGHYEKLFDTIYFDIIPTVIVVSCSLPIIFFYSWVLFTVLIVYATLFIWISFKFSSWTKQSQEELARARTKHTGIISDQIGNIQTIKFFGRDNEEVERYVAWNKVKTKFRITTWMRNFVYHQTSGVLRVVTDAIMLSTCFYLWTQGSIEIGGIILAMSYNGRISDRMWQLGNVIKTLRIIEADCVEMMETLEVKPTVVDQEQPIPCTISAGDIRFNHVTFRYPGTEKNVFTDFSLHIRAGEKVGIVGASGSGKSTLMHLLMRMMDIQSGEILIDGIPIHKVRQQELRQSMSIVPQDTVLFHRTVFENIAYDKPDATAEEVIAAAKKAQAHEFISGLTNKGYSGYNVKVGERGIKLSGGQRQRIGLARAFLQHKPVLILDEATSSLDSLSEKKIQKGLENLLHEQGTMIIIAHRLATVHQLDRIIVLDHGKLIEDGTPDELYSIKDGAYRRLVEAQQLIVEEA